MTLQDELQMMLEKTRRYIKSAAVLQLEGDHDLGCPNRPSAIVRFLDS
jgi:hypothetical protein